MKNVTNLHKKSDFTDLQYHTDNKPGYDLTTARHK
jgi:hypothetical protein